MAWKLLQVKTRSCCENFNYGDTHSASANRPKSHRNSTLCAAWGMIKQVKAKARGCQGYFRFTAVGPPPPAELHLTNPQAAIKPSMDPPCLSRTHTSPPALFLLMQWSLWMEIEVSGTRSSNIGMMVLTPVGSALEAAEGHRLRL